ncbi:MAG: hypothetical protein CL550_02305 [Alcanivorax sp.]|nr:hypothetical protein [Alcanivorax sp.]
MTDWGGLRADHRLLLVLPTQSVDKIVEKLRRIAARPRKKAFLSECLIFTQLAKLIILSNLPLFFRKWKMTNG